MNQNCFAPTIVSVNAVSHYVKLNALLLTLYGGVLQEGAWTHTPLSPYRTPKRGHRMPYP